MIRFSLIFFFLFLGLESYSQILPGMFGAATKKNSVSSSDTWDSSIKPSCTTFSNSDRTSLENNCSNNWSTVYGEIAVSSGIQEWEVTINSLNEDANTAGVGLDMTIGIVNLRNNKDTWSTNSAATGTIGYVYFNSNGHKETNLTGSNVNTPYGASYSAGDVIKISLNMNNRELTFYKNGTSQGVAYTVATGTYYLSSTFYKGSGASLTIN